MLEPLIKYMLNAFVAGVMAVSGQAAEIPKAVQTGKDPIPIAAVTDLKASTISVSCIKVEWEAEKDRDYHVECSTYAGYVENMYFEFRGNSLCYITGLREGSEYEITVTPLRKERENVKLKSQTVKAETETVEVIWEFEHIDGWTNAFAGDYQKNIFIGINYI